MNHGNYLENMSSFRYGIPDHLKECYAIASPRPLKLIHMRKTYQLFALFALLFWSFTLSAQEEWPDSLKEIKIQLNGQEFKIQMDVPIPPPPPASLRLGTDGRESLNEIEMYELQWLQCAQQTNLLHVKNKMLR